MFVRNFNMTLAASGTLEAGAKFQYLRTFVRGKDLHQFDFSSADVEITKTLDVDYIIRGLVYYFPPVNLISKTEALKLPWNEKPCSLTVRRYAERLIDINEYLVSFLGRL